MILVPVFIHLHIQVIMYIINLLYYLFIHAILMCLTIIDVTGTAGTVARLHAVMEITHAALMDTFV